MPLALLGRTKDVVISVPRSARWQAGVERFLRTLSDDDDRINRDLRLLEERLDGRLPWREVLAGATLPNGRPMPASRRYAEMLVTEDRLPLYEAGPLRLSVDLHNPQNEAGVPEYDSNQLEIALVADTGYFSTAPGSVFPQELGFEELAISEAMLRRMDTIHRSYPRIERRRLANGALFVQYRSLFGSESRSEGASIDTPLARQAGLRSTNLLFRA